jgi:hypothetical protein
VRPGGARLPTPALFPLATSGSRGAIVPRPRNDGGGPSRDAWHHQRTEPRPPAVRTEPRPTGAKFSSFELWKRPQLAMMFFAVCRKHDWADQPRRTRVVASAVSFFVMAYKSFWFSELFESRHSSEHVAENMNVSLFRKWIGPD